MNATVNPSPPGFGLDLELETLISQQLVGRGIEDQRVLAAFRRVPRAAFVPDYFHHKMYLDDYLPIGLGESIAPAYVTARMLQELRLVEGARVLEIGTGTGFQTALLAKLAAEVHTVEMKPELSARARKLLLSDLGITNVHFHVSDGFHGWSEAAPFDGIVVGCAVDDPPWPLVGQLRQGAKLVIPVGDKRQVLRVVTRTGFGAEAETVAEDVFQSKLSRMQGEIDEL
ncbi:MAG: protein-L-isoaspartate O-methyltransferase [Proteobacteria bacterium]|nr:MAG: protein-L-isoaspartate O-methyltransferase [Pseudomonadota bacterium]